MAWILLSFRRLRDARVALAGLALLVLVTAFVFALAPTILSAIGDDALRGEVRAAMDRDRDLQVSQERRVSADPRAALDGVDELGRRLEAAMPASVQDLTVERSFVVDTPRWSIDSPTKAQANLTLRWQPIAAEHIRYVTGRAPDPTVTSTPWPATTSDPAGAVPAFEGAVSQTTADALGVAVGDDLRLAIDATDRLAAGHRERIVLRITGIFAVDDPTAPSWVGDRRLEIPGSRALSPDDVYIDAYALVADESYTEFFGLTDPDQLPLHYAWRWVIDPERMTAGQADGLVRDLRRMEGVFRSEIGNVGGRGPAVLQSGLLRIVEAQQARWRSASVILTVIAIGPAVVAAAAIALAGALVARRRRGTLSLWRGRGASTAQLVGSLLVEGLIVVVPAAVLATAGVIALVPGGSTRVAGAIAAVVAAIAVVLLITAARPTRVAPPGVGEREPGLRRVSGRRLVFEGAIVGIAILGAYLLRDRGLASTSSTARSVGADPLIVAVPALVGVAAGVVAVRLAPLLLSAVAIAAGSRRDLVPSLGMRRATRGTGGGTVLLILLATATLATFSAATLLQVVRSAEAVAWLEVGAPYRVTSTRPLPADLGTTLDGAGPVAAARPDDAQLGDGAGLVRTLVLDAAAYDALARGTPADPALPLAFLVPGGGPVPAIISTAVASARPPLTVGDTASLIVGASPVEVTVVGIRPDFPSLPGVDRFVVIAREPLAAAYPRADLPPTELFVSAPISAAADLRASLATLAPDATLLDRADRTRSILDSPVIAALMAGAAAAAVVTAIYAALAVGAALVLAGAARALETAHLRTLGLSRRGAVGLLVVELGPIVILAFLLGGLLGLGLFAFLQPGLGLDALLGTQAPVPVVVEPGPLLLVLGAALAVVAAGLGLAAYVQSRAVPALAIRGGLEP